MKQFTTDVLVIGGGAGGIAAAISASRYGVKTILATEFSWLGGMLTSAGVSAPDGNELASWHTGLWGAYLKELQQRHTGGLDNGWVSLFTYHPGCGASIFADWVAQIPNLIWIKNCLPRSVIKKNQLVTGVRFDDFFVEAQITIDATELGDVIALADIPFRWGWESFEEFNEPSLKTELDLATLSKEYPVQAPTWVFLLQKSSRDKNQNNTASAIDSVVNYSLFQDAWKDYGKEKFLNYGKLTNNLYMINWPIAGNDYGYNLDRLIRTESYRKEWLTEAYNHSYSFANYLLKELDRSYGLADSIFPQQNNPLLPDINPAFALHPYYRESRRLIGQTTITEQNILPVDKGCVAPLPTNEKGKINAIAVGNYANDHHYPGFDFKLESKSIKWGGRWTGTPFTIPYDALVPLSIDGLLVAEKNISVSHIANGSTRLQPVVMNIGQAAGTAAALCIKHNCQPRDLAVREIQEALLIDKIAPAAVIPLFNLTLDHPRWLYWQRYYLDYPEAYPIDGNCPDKTHKIGSPTTLNNNYYSGIFYRHDYQQYTIQIVEPLPIKNQTWELITIYPQMNRQLLNLKTGSLINVIAKKNNAGNWLIVEDIL